MSEYIVRDATPSDVLDIVLSVKSFCKEIPHPAWSKVNATKVNSLVTALIDSPNGFVNIVETEGEVVGALIAIVSDIPISDFMFAQELMFWVDPEHRNGKTASKLISNYVEWSKAKGCKFIRLSELDKVLEGKAGLLFKRKGFKPIETAYVMEV